MTFPGDLQARLQALAALLPAIERGQPDDFGVWEPSREDAQGVWSMPYVTYGPLEATFRAAAAGWVRPDIDWMTWAGTDEGRGYLEDPVRISSAPAEDLARLLTTIVRGDRFNEGMLLSAFERGVLSAIARRASALLGEGHADRG